MKLSYDDILDEIYDFSSEDDSEKDITFLKKVDNYHVFLVKTYEAGLSINSPAWCLKTKTHWNTYINKGVNVVAIDQKYVKGLKTNLPTPNTYFSDTYTNTKNPSIRYGITLYKGSAKYEYFNDDNKISNKDLDIVERIANSVRELDIIKSKLVTTKEEELSVDFIDDIFSEIIEKSGEDTYRSFDYTYYKLSDNDTEQILKVLNTMVINTSDEQNIKVIDYLRKQEIKNIVLGNSTFHSCCGIYDILIYLLYGKDSLPLSGMYLKEREDYDKCFRYTYGVHKTDWGVKYILQSYDSLISYYKDIVDNFDKLIIGDEYYGEILPIEFKYEDENNLHQDFHAFYNYKKENDYYIINFFVEKYFDYLKRYDIKIHFWRNTDSISDIERMYNTLYPIFSDIEQKSDDKLGGIYFELIVGNK